MLNELVKEGSILGGGSFLLSSIMSIMSNSQKNEMTKWKLATRAQAEDVKDARTKDFKFTRRLIVISLFIFTPVLCYWVASKGLVTSMPFVAHTDILWGAIHTKTLQVKEAYGFVLLVKPISALMWAISGFYFGSKFKN